VRVFVAVKLDEDIKKAIAGVSSEIKRKSRAGRYADPANYHITLEFIGETDSERLCKIHEAMDDAASESQAFEVKVEGLGIFGKPESATVWMGVSSGSSKLMEINKKLACRLEEAGFKKDEKKFNPHITIGRKVDSRDIFNDIKSGDWIQRVESIVLMESARENGKLLYTQIYESRFEK